MHLDYLKQNYVKQTNGSLAFYFYPSGESITTYIQNEALDGLALLERLGGGIRKIGNKCRIQSYARVVQGVWYYNVFHICIAVSRTNEMYRAETGKKGISIYRYFNSGIVYMMVFYLLELALSLLPNTPQRSGTMTIRGGGWWCLWWHRPFPICRRSF